MKCIGITGPTGAGKTTVLNALDSLDLVMIDGDAVYHRLTEDSRPLQEALVARFGNVYQGNTLNRKQLGEIVFQDKVALADLNDIAHRFVGEEVDRLIAQGEVEGKHGAVIDAIALIESGLGAKCQAIVGILAPAQVRLERIMTREGISAEYAQLRIDAQKKDDFFRAHCTHILENDGDETREAFGNRGLALFTNILNGGT